MWDVLARPLRTARRAAADAVRRCQRRRRRPTIGALNVYDSSLGDIKANLTPGSVVKVRLLEGFSGEEGGVDMFGTTEFDGQSRYGEMPVQRGRLVRGQGAGQRAVPHPADRQVRHEPGQRVDLDQRPRAASSASAAAATRAGPRPRPWPRASRGGPARRHQPGAPRAQRVDDARIRSRAATCRRRHAPSDNAVRGVPWDMAIQPILDAKCVSCHDGTPGAGQPELHDHRHVTGMTQTFTFDLRGQKVDVTIGERMTGDFTASYLSLMGLGEILGDADVTYIAGAAQAVRRAGLGDEQLGHQDAEPAAALPDGQHGGPRLLGSQRHERRDQPRRRQGRPGAHGGRVLPA